MTHDVVLWATMAMVKDVVQKADRFRDGEGVCV